MKQRIFFSVGALIAVWLLWIVAYRFIANEYILPSFSETIHSLFQVLGEGAFWRALLNSLWRTLLAFAVSVLLGIGLALLARLFDGIRFFLAPIVSVLRTLPTMAVILILLIWTTPSVAPVIVSALVLFPAAYAAALASMDEVHESYGALSRAYGITRTKQAFRMYLPLSAPSILKQAGAILSMGLKITVSGEVLSSTAKSLGGMMQEAKLFVEMPRLLALTIVAVLLGFVLEGLCALLAKYCVRWRT